ncbi:MAG: HAMP domain-containing histidine kinase [Helicobacteraceae bacterium]|jgi:signal transduction histidine kinase|nr:HAMP domain-containing histidine kinase [Helicobacteraceae bacterium]
MSNRKTRLHKDDIRRIYFRRFFANGVFICSFIAGYYIAKEFLAIGSDFVSYIIPALIGLTLFYAIMIIGATIFRYTHGRRNPKDIYLDFLSEIMSALNKVSQGDFNVFIESQNDRLHNPPQLLKDLANSVNKMASQLGTMEQARQDFISNVSHEIQSPITSISGFAALLRNEKLSAEEKKRYLDVIETESVRLSKLSDNLLKLSALEAQTTPLNSAPFELDKQIENVVLALEPQWIRKDLTLELSMEKIEFIGDKELLAQAWVNLLRNAIKFTPPKGKIYISLKEKGENIYFTITDNGIGISKEDQVHIFERFYKADKSRDRGLEGSGLGLSIVKKIANIHGARIQIKSAPNKGASFILAFPCENLRLKNFF